MQLFPGTDYSGWEFGVLGRDVTLHFRGFFLVKYSPTPLDVCRTPVYMLRREHGHFYYLLTARERFLLSFVVVKQVGMLLVMPTLKKRRRSQSRQHRKARSSLKPGNRRELSAVS